MLSRTTFFIWYMIVLTIFYTLYFDKDSKDNNPRWVDMEVTEGYGGEGRGREVCGGKVKRNRNIIR